MHIVLTTEAINQMTHWFQRTDLNLLLNLEGVTEARFLNALDFLENQDFLKMQKQIFQCVTRKYKLSNKGILYDVTNTYLYGEKCPLGKPGKDKDGVKGRPLIQIGLGVTKEEGIPVFHQVFDGNIAAEKLTQYLLVLRKRNDKSRWLAQVGYTLENGQLLEKDLRTQILSLDAILTENTKYGQMYEIRGALAGPNGRTLAVCTMWITETATGDTKFITMYPDKESNNDL